MTQRYFTSDPHIGHELVAWTRGFERTDLPQKWSDTLGIWRNVGDSAAHDAVLAGNWDRVVRPDDQVFVVGDIAMNPRRAGAFQWFRDRPGVKHLISGNHDETHNMRTHSLRAQMSEEWGGTFATINDFTRLKIAGRSVWLSHFPYEGEGDRDMEDRLPEYREPDFGYPLIHGHTHAKHRAHLSERGTPMFHVGPDAWDMQLVPEQTIQDWLEYLP